ncbi:hypothetical protein CGRA01v4_13368 [Colletotrichum graminicola]|uniref:Uncharacterized protein n=1 Tax=Colletotrichum graminicola (strain M1.001 / M2 / FGSC 10212) TaxID=645133 RepID=E3QWV1_COLGM|nr:uncharacterized protein GLRG_10483 [Colletotrichum graminicola M1.001]EFQ35339.1 hypothetical protein GLRG_10483 [Colletotrichum graminicola M1.001]WDK22078.1 hypothetical protein CGRA01v4_13368 [Colletotrichum graminicola]
MSNELPRHERRPSSPTQYSSSSKSTFGPCDMSIKTLLGFISTRVLRGGPRFIIQLILAAFGLLLLGKFLASPTSTDTLFSSGSRWSWSPFSESKGQQGVGVRVVVFGSPDIATPSTDKGVEGKGWTEMLCDELRCSSHQSFIPSTSLPAQAMTTTKHYRDTLENLTSKVDHSKPFGYNYSFLVDQFPLSDAIANLTSQIDAFLALPKPHDVPRETVWVFTFGTWDVWTLASLPRDVGGKILDAAVEALFAQVERIYQASLDADSVAFSDFWAHQDTISPLAELNAMEQGRDVVDPREIENFRVIVPELFDVSMTPGWQAQRPAPPQPHNKAEQMTNAAYLTTKWNSEVKSCMDEWMRTPDPEPEDGDEDDFGYVATRVRRSFNEGDAPLVVPFPRRVGAQVDAASFIREAIVERQMRNQGLTDATGRGNRTGGEQGNVFFSETWVPCIWASTSNASETAEAADKYAACGARDDYLFHSPFTLSQRAIRETARIAAAEARRTLAFVDRTEGGEGEGRKQGETKEPAAAAMSKRRERRGQLSGFQRITLPDHSVRPVNVVCPSADVC